MSLDRFYDPDDTASMQAFRKKALDSFAYCVSYCWEVLDLQSKAALSPIELDMANYIAHGPSRRFLFAWRESGKSMIGTQLYPLWYMLKYPDHNIRILSKSGGQAQKFVVGIKTMMQQIPLFQQLMPPKNGPHRNNTTLFDSGLLKLPNREPTLQAQGVEGQLAAGRHHLCIIDDGETDQNPITADAKAGLLNIYSQVYNMAYKSNGLVPNLLAIGTYNPAQSIYPTLFNKDAGYGYAVRSYPIVYPTHKQRARIPGLAPVIAAKIDSGEAVPGEAVNHERYSPETIADILSQPRSQVERHYIGIPDSSGDNDFPLRLGDLLVYPCSEGIAPVQLAWGATSGDDPTLLDIQTVGQAGDRFRRPIYADAKFGTLINRHARIDPAGSGGDETTCAIGGTLGGKLFVQELLGLRFSPTGAEPEATTQALLRTPDSKTPVSRSYGLRLIAQRLKLRKTTSCTVESNAGGELFAHALQQEITRISDQEWSCRVDCKPSTKNKQSRIIDSLEGPFQNHQIVFDPTVAADQILQGQLAMTAKGVELQHDDRADVLAALVNDLSTHLHFIPEQAAQVARDRIQAWEEDSRPSKDEQPYTLGGRFLGRSRAYSGRGRWED